MIPAQQPAVVIGRSSNLLELHATGYAPRPEFDLLCEVAGARLVEFNAESFKGGRLLTRLCNRDAYLGSAVELMRQQEEIDAAYMVGERLGARVALLLRCRRWQGRLITLVHKCIGWRGRMLMRAVGHRPFHRIICVSQAQRRILVEELGFPADKVLFAYNWVDTDFFRPTGALPPPGIGPAMVVSAGLEARDYETLSEAARQAPELAFTLVASGFPGRRKAGAMALAPNLATIPAWVNYTDLRDLYAAARVVAVPLHPVPYAAGVTTIVEAMAMGKPVVVSDSPGIAEYVEHGVSGLVVPCGDAGALAAALRELAAAPARCAEMGRRNRAWVEAHAGMAEYARQVAGLLRGTGRGA